MNRKELRTALQTIQKEIRAKRAAGDVDGEIEWRGRKAAVLVSAQRFAKAASELDEAASLAESQQQVGNAARARLAQGQALANLVQFRPQAQAVFEQAAALFAKASEPLWQVKTLRHLVGLQAGSTNYDAALTTASHALALMQQHPSQPAMQVEMLRLRASCAALARQFSLAEQDLSKATTLAQENQLAALEDACRQQRQANAAMAKGFAPEQFAHLAHIANPQGHLVADAGIAEGLAALKNGRYQAALRQSQTSLENARQATDPQRIVRYLLASLLIAESEDALNNRVGVLVALLRCKVYLEKQLGQLVGQYMNQLLDSLADRWGRAALQEAVADYQAHVAKHGLIQL